MAVRELVGPGVAGYEIRCVILNSEFQPELVGLDVNERFPAVGEVIVVEVEVRNLGLGAGEVQTEVIDVETGRVLAVRQDRIDPGTTVQLTLEVEMWDAGGGSGVAPGWRGTDRFLSVRWVCVMVLGGYRPPPHKCSGWSVSCWSHPFSPIAIGVNSLRWGTTSMTSSPMRKNETSSHEPQTNAEVGERSNPGGSRSSRNGSQVRILPSAPFSMRNNAS